MAPGVVVGASDYRDRQAERRHLDHSVGCVDEQLSHGAKAFRRIRAESSSLEGRGLRRWRASAPPAVVGQSRFVHRLERRDPHELGERSKGVSLGSGAEPAANEHTSVTDCHVCGACNAAACATNPPKEWPTR